MERGEAGTVGAVYQTSVAGIGSNPTRSAINAK
jgi:hypothetical protein